MRSDRDGGMDTDGVTGGDAGRGGGGDTGRGGGAPQNVRFAGALVALQGAVGAAVAVVFAVRALGAGGPALYYGLAEAGFFLLCGAAVAGIGWGLWAGHRAVRTPAIVVQLLLLPAVYSLIGPSRQLLWGVLTGAVVILTFLLLISEQSRRWSMGTDDPNGGTR